MLKHNSEDIFRADTFPEMMNELNTLKQKTAHTPVYFKPDIIISYLKNRSINNEWIKANPELTKFITSDPCATKHIESIFQSYRSNLPYMHSYETYIRSVFLRGSQN